MTDIDKIGIYDLDYYDLFLFLNTTLVYKCQTLKYKRHFSIYSP